MSFFNKIKVSYTYYTNKDDIDAVLNFLSKHNVLSLDTETQPIWSFNEVKDAKEKLDKYADEYKNYQDKLIQISEASGISTPEMIKTTHFIFSYSDRKSIIIICNSYHEELKIWNWIKNANVKFIIHNATFDLKIMYHRVKGYPKNFEDTQIIMRVLTNNANEFKSKTGLKHLMKRYYDPEWTSVIDEEENEEGYHISNLLDEKFLKYAAIDGAATYKLYKQILKNVDYNF